MSAPNLAHVSCPECGGTGRVEARPRCRWCREAVAEHSCNECDRPLCEDCIFTRRCLACIPDDEFDEMLEEVAA